MLFLQSINIPKISNLYRKNIFVDKHYLEPEPWSTGQSLHSEDFRCVKAAIENFNGNSSYWMQLSHKASTRI